MFRQRGEQFDFVRVFLIALHGPRRLLNPTLYHFQISHSQFKIDNLNIAGGVGDALHVDDVFVVETAHDVHDSVGFADIGKEFIPEALALTRAAYQSGDVDELHDGGGLFQRLIEGRQRVETGVGHGDNARIRFDGAKGIIRAVRARVGDCVIERGLAHVGQSDNASFHEKMPPGKVFRHCTTSARDAQEAIRIRPADT